MLTRFAILGLMAIAVATLLDRGSVWAFTVDADRRLTMAAYWTLHALLLALIVVLYRSLEQRQRPAPVAILGLLSIAVLGTTFSGLLVADGIAFIQLAFVEMAPGVLAIIVVALLLRMIWRLFRDPKELLTKRDETAEKATWNDALYSIVLVPVAVFAFVSLIALIGLSWRTGSAVLDYALLGRDPATLDWSYPWGQLERYVGQWEIFALIGGAMILGVLMEKLFPAKPRRDDAQ